MWLDSWIAPCLIPLAIWISLSGLDDLFISLVWLWPRKKTFVPPTSLQLSEAEERPLVIMVPLWHEHRVIGQMLDTNLAAIRYREYDVFVGVYPNDPLTIRAVADAARRHPRVHLVVVPHDGPTSKGDCLNAIFSSVQQYELRHDTHFEVAIIHDAEDLVHPDSLRQINWHSRNYEMVQIPVLALPTGLAEFTHGLYCDEFAEYQSKDIPVRQLLGGFLPSNGVGTGFERGALDRLAATRDGMYFDPECLTEDYETGYALHALGCRQLFVPLQFEAGVPMATREYFPRNLRSAIRQRSRWVLGIALQGWQRHGWKASKGQWYWFWRDRKGLIGNLLTPVANLLFLGGIGRCFGVGPLPGWLGRLCIATIGLSILQAAIRTCCSARIYGWKLAAGVLPRVLWGNVVNCAATFLAVTQFVSARLRGRSLAWRKTEHVYPVHGPIPIGEILVRLNYISAEALQRALDSQPPGVRIGEHLVCLKELAEEDVYDALNVQAGLEPTHVAQQDIDPLTTRLLPQAVVRKWHAVPYRVDLGQVHLLIAEPPTSAATRELAAFCNLELRFRLVPRTVLEEVAQTQLTSLN